MRRRWNVVGDEEVPRQRLARHRLIAVKVRDTARGQKRIVDLKSRAVLSKTAQAASAMMSGLRAWRIRCSPPSRFLIAAVAIMDLGHNAFTAMPFGRSSPARPSTTRLMPNLAML
jgi:hypothetical protein